MSLKGWLVGMDNSFRFKLPCFGDADGKLIPFVCSDIPDFKVNRLFYICDVPYGEVRADHACMNADIVLIAVSGSVSVSVETNNVHNEYALSRKDFAIYIPKKSWIKAYNFSGNAVLMGLSNKEYADCDYLDDYDEYLKRIGKGS